MNAINKLFQVFGLFTGPKGEWTVEEAADALGYPVSTAYRFFKSLSEQGLIVAYAAGRYTLGPAIILLDRQIRLQDLLIRTANNILKRLAAETQIHGTYLLCRLYQKQVMCVLQQSIGSSILTATYERGRLMPLHRGASSKVILAHMPLRSTRSYYETHAEDMERVGLGPGWDLVKQSLKQIRKEVLCKSLAELDHGAVGLAAPVFLNDVGVIGSLGFTALEQDASQEALSEVGRMIVEAAEEITSCLQPGAE